VYALLVEAMERSRLAGIAKYVMRDKQHLGCLRVRDGVITLEKMYFPDEIRPIDEIAPAQARVDEREREMAGKLIESFTGTFQPEKYEDTYRDALCEIIRAKRKGEKPPKPEPEPERPTDLMAALRASLEAAQARRGGAHASTDGSVDDELETLSKDELYERAKAADIKGRADMSKEELVEALKAAA
jgi:DNA end-binding protein Ku